MGSCSVLRDDRGQAVRGKPHCNSQQAPRRPTLNGCGVAPPRPHGKCSPLPGRLPTTIGKGGSWRRWRRGWGGGGQFFKGLLSGRAKALGEKKSCPAEKSPDSQETCGSRSRCTGLYRSSRVECQERGPEVLRKAVSAEMKCKHLQVLRRGDIPGPPWRLRPRGLEEMPRAKGRAQGSKASTQGGLLRQRLSGSPRGSWEGSSPTGRAPWSHKGGEGEFSSQGLEAPRKGSFRPKECSRPQRLKEKANVGGPEADGRGHYWLLGLWGTGGGLPVQRLVGRDLLWRTPIQPISQRVPFTWIALSSFRKRWMSSGPFSMVGMRKCWRRESGEGRAARPRPLLPSRLQWQPHLTLPWYRIWCTGQTWQAVPEPKTSRTRPSSSARSSSFMVIFRSATRNSPCRAVRMSPTCPSTRRVTKRPEERISREKGRMLVCHSPSTPKSPESSGPQHSS